MSSWLRFFLPVLLCGSSVNVWASSDESNAIKAIRQAPDPSAVVAAFAAGSALMPDNPKVLEAYVSRMDDLGMPEMAFHQAQALATMDPANGVAWATVAYVDARRNDMPDALSAIDKAARYAPDNPFVQRTAGGVVAWYDSQAPKGAESPTDAEALANVRTALANRADYTTAYNASRQAYANPTAQPGVAPPQGVAPEAPSASTYSPAYPPDYYAPDYAYAPEYGLAYGSDYPYAYYPGWAPWPWWEPPGYFYGSFFVPFGTFVFGGHEDFEHHHDYFHGRGFDHGRFIAHGGSLEHRGFAGTRSFNGFARNSGFAHPAFRSGGHNPTIFARPGTTWSRSFSGSHLAPMQVAPHMGSFGNRGFAGGFHGGAGHAMGGGLHAPGGFSHGGGFGGGHQGGHR